MYTEDEAKKKWCPVMTNAVKGSLADGYCIASDCMMWKTVPQEPERTFKTFPYKQGDYIFPQDNEKFDVDFDKWFNEAPEKEGYEKVKDEEDCGIVYYKEMPNKGYCGLTGE